MVAQKKGVTVKVRENIVAVFWLLNVQQYAACV